MDSPVWPDSAIIQAMVPTRLHLHNFLSYGDACGPIDLSGIHVGCLSGPNGHGKSALLDAITWCLWGKARTNSADDLIRLGQAEMFVDLEFRLEGQLYRVVRKRTRGSRSDLQLQVRQGDGQWRSLSGQGVRDTEQRIQQLLRMDYDTFINSAFILQGRADEFTRKTPGERKRILAEILNLQIYDLLTQAARERASQASAQVQALDAEIARLESEYARLPEIARQVEQCEHEHTLAELDVERARNAHREVEVRRAHLEARKRERDDLAARLTRDAENVKPFRDQLDRARRQHATCLELLARADEIRARHAEYGRLRRERDELVAARRRLRELEQAAQEQERSVECARANLQGELRVAEQRVRELTARIRRIPDAQREVAALEREVAGLERLEAELLEVQEAIRQHGETRAAATTALTHCEERLEQASQRFRLLKAAEAVCPLCDGPLSPEKRLELGRQLREERQRLEEQRNHLIQAKDCATREELRLKRRESELQRELAKGRTCRDRLAQARQTLLTLEESAKELPEEEARLTALRKRLETGDYAPEARRRLEALREEIAAVPYDENRDLHVTAQLDKLASAERDLEDLQQAEANRPALEEQIRGLEATLRRHEETIQADREKLAAMEREIEELPTVQTEAARREAALREAEQRRNAAAQALGAARRLLAECQSLGERIAERKEERRRTADDHALYEELARAFGKNGIQALLIENALPEIEAEANRLLQRMTDGEMHVRLRTQRELQSGGQAETLEIEIADGMGTRRYEMFSGGEAFRVNFALRIALSKLLTRRAGARLETLFIDEGFGSQDHDGRQRLVEAIQAIQDDFGCILVITHLDDLKEAFPTRIEVTRGPNGSQVTIY